MDLHQLEPMQAIALPDIFSLPFNDGMTFPVIVSRFTLTIDAITHKLESLWIFHVYLISLSVYFSRLIPCDIRLSLPVRFSIMVRFSVNSNSG